MSPVFFWLITYLTIYIKEPYYKQLLSDIQTVSDMAQWHEVVFSPLGMWTMSVKMQIRPLL